jgi:hypothetical protein
VDALIGADESLLRHVLSLAAFAHQAVAYVKNTRLVNLDEFAKRLGITATGA